MESKHTFLLRALILAVTAFVAVAVKAQDAQIKAMNQIREYPEKYVWGTSSDPDENVAKQNARAELTNNITSMMVANVSSRMDDNKDSFSFEFQANSIAKVSNVHDISYYDKKKRLYHTMCYMERSEIEKAQEIRQNKIKDLITLGIEQESKLNIADALKYYTWSLMMLNAFQDYFLMELEGKEQYPMPWLNTHIPMILDNITISLASNKLDIDFSPDEIDKYTVNLDVKYAGYPVSALDLGYFNGLREINPIHAKNGEVALAFPDLSDSKEISMRIIYDYADEAKRYDKELETVYNGSPHRVSFQDRQHRSLPIKIKKDIISQPKKKESPTSATSFKSEPIIATARKTISRPATDDQALTQSMISVEKALRSRKYNSVKPLFTDEGWEIFSSMTSLMKVRVSRTPDSYTVESTNLSVVGKGIPLTLSNDGHVTNETLVFRFEKETGLIKSVAFALTKRAEDDIFRESSWGMESRYALLQFMEDYQTAFALKRTNYIEQIFSDDAVIITGKFTDNKACKRFYEADAFKTSGKEVSYTRHNKDSYISALKNDFRNNKFIQLVFEDAIISKVDTRGFSNNEIMWIEIKQNYNSSTYSDKGFLSLMIDLKPIGSQIHVRAWTPQFIEIDELKERFNIGI